MILIYSVMYVYLFIGGCLTLEILVETSARHIHISKGDMAILFGDGVSLTCKKELSQPGQFVSFERVDVLTPKGELKGVSILGPIRPYTQVEISLSDARKIGVTAAIRDSGNIQGTCGCKLVGPKGEIDIPCGVIAAKRHIHLDPETAKEYNLTNKEIVSVQIKTINRSLIFGDVVIRVNKKFAPAMHIDTDESNAAGIDSQTYGEIIK